MRVLILGGYGFIGLEIARRAVATGHEVTGLGRSADAGKRRLPGIRWLAVDIATLKTPALWHDYLSGIDAVVNASGALQSGARDDLQSLQGSAIAALIAACETAGVQRFVQISAPGVAPDASTEFLRTKALGDSCVNTSKLNWTILRPGLVIGRNAFGGSALIRVLASLPVVQPLVFAEREIQAVALTDVTAATLDAIEGRLPAHREFDLVEDQPRTLRDVLAAVRVWLGLPAARFQPAVPVWLAFGIAKFADLLGYLGWRSPLRSTSLRVLADNVVGDPRPYRDAGGATLLSLEETLAEMPATLQERWFARLYLLMPMIVAMLGLFWLLSGAIGLLRLDQAAALIDASVGRSAARVLVIGGAVIDIALGLAVMIRVTARVACIGMVVVTLAYLVGGSMLRPDLWLDPLGPLLKTLPAMLLAVVGLVLLEER